MKKAIFYISFCLTTIFAQAQSYNRLWIPDTLSGKTFNLAIKDTFAQLVAGNQTITGGINNKFWGPTLFVNKGDTVQMNVHNGLNDSTTLHWHGFHLPAVMDGGPHQIIPPGAMWQPYWKITNNAATYWFHPHLDMMTQEQVSKGIGGLIIVRDEIESALKLPRKYGIDDFPLVLTDRDFDKNNQFELVSYGDSVMVNGTLRPEHTIPAQIVHFRVLDAAIERSFLLGFSDNRPFYVICSDGGLLNAPVLHNRYLIHAGERVEILVDFSQDKGKTVDLMAYNKSLPSTIAGGENQPIGPLKNYLGNKDFRVLHLNIGTTTPNPITTIPKTLTNNILLKEAEANFTRKLTITDSFVVLPPPAMGIDMFLLNHKLFKMDYNNYTVPLGNTEIWEITNSSIFGHPFHIHDVEFNILSINGEAPDAAHAGWKDVVFVPAKEKGKNGVVRFIAKFEDYADSLHPFMYHCHIATHEDEGMMGQFLVREKSEIKAETGKSENLSCSLSMSSDKKRLFAKLSNTDAPVYYITLKNELGRTISMLPMPRLKAGIDISHLPKGNYELELIGGKFKEVLKQKFVISN